MRSSALFLIVLLSAACVLAQTAAVPQSGNSTRIDASDVWQVPQDFVAKAHAACDKAKPANYGQCFIDQMKKEGAPDKAVSFSLMLHKQTDGQVGVMVGFKPAGPVDMARVMYPLRANDNYGLLLVNGDPPVLDVDDLKKLAPKLANPEGPMLIDCKINVEVIAPFIMEVTQKEEGK